MFQMLKCPATERVQLQKSLKKNIKERAEVKLNKTGARRRVAAQLWRYQVRLGTTTSRTLAWQRHRGRSSCDEGGSTEESPT